MWELARVRAKRFEQYMRADRFSVLKQNHGRNFVFVRGQAKVHANLMFDLVPIFGLQVLRF